MRKTVSESKTFNFSNGLKECLSVLKMMTKAGSFASCLSFL